MYFRGYGEDPPTPQAGTGALPPPPGDMTPEQAAQVCASNPELCAPAGSGLTSTTVLGLSIGTLAVLGIGAYLLLRKKGPRRNPPVRRRRRRRLRLQRRRRR